MTTIHRLGDVGRAGSKLHPTTYQINSCPTCYGVLYWLRPRQTVIKCDNCDTITYVRRYSSPIDYIRQKIVSIPLSSTTFLLALWALVQYVDHYLRLRKVLLYLFIRGVSYL
jgi:hypothetical protein